MLHSHHNLFIAPLGATSSREVMPLKRYFTTSLLGSALKVDDSCRTVPSKNVRYSIRHLCEVAPQRDVRYSIQFLCEPVPERDTLHSIEYLCQVPSVPGDQHMVLASGTVPTATDRDFRCSMDNIVDLPPAVSEMRSTVSGYKTAPRTVEDQLGAAVTASVARSHALEAKSTDPEIVARQDLGQYIDSCLGKTTTSLSSQDIIQRIEDLVGSMRPAPRSMNVQPVERSTSTSKRPSEGVQSRSAKRRKTLKQTVRNTKAKLSTKEDGLKFLQDSLRLPRKELAPRRSFFPDPVFVSIDIENIGAFKCIQNGTMNRRIQLGVAILDTRDIEGGGNPDVGTSTETPPESLITTHNFVSGGKDYCHEVALKFAFGAAREIPTFNFLAELEAVIPRSRSIILVGHGIRANDAIALGHVGFDFDNGIVGVLDTQRIAEQVFPDFRTRSLQDLLTKVGCSFNPLHLHCAGNDANFTLRALLLLAELDYHGCMGLHPEDVKKLWLLNTIAHAEWNGLEGQINDVVQNRPNKTSNTPLSESQRGLESLPMKPTSVLALGLLGSVELKESVNMDTESSHEALVDFDAPLPTLLVKVCRFLLERCLMRRLS